MLKQELEDESLRVGILVFVLVCFFLGGVLQDELMFVRDRVQELELMDVREDVLELEVTLIGEREGVLSLVLVSWTVEVRADGLEDGSTVTRLVYFLMALRSSFSKLINLLVVFMYLLIRLFLLIFLGIFLAFRVILVFCLWSSLAFTLDRFLIGVDVFSLTIFRNAVRTSGVSGGGRSIC